jgi:hypothetical protein
VETKADRRIYTGWTTFLVGTGVAYLGSEVPSLVLETIGVCASLAGLGYAVWAMIAKRRTKPGG